MQPSSGFVPTPPTLSQALRKRYQKLVRQLFAPIDIASLVYFRIAFGAIMLWEVWRYFSKGWIPRYWIDPVMNFTYYGFDWVRPLPGPGMYLVFGGLGILSVLIMIGWHYRLSASLFFIGFTYTFLLEQARYLNHFYLICLISFLMIFLPVHRAFSIDAVRRRGVAAQVAPTWTLWLLRAQLSIVYFYAGVAKLNPDWLRAEPLRTWLAARTDFPLIGQFFTDEWMVYSLSYGGLLLDLLAAPFLLWRRTRWVAFFCVLTFHLMNVRLFSIGIFPWFMIAATALFFPPSFPRDGLRRLRQALGWWQPDRDRPGGRGKLSRVAPIRARRSTIILGLGLYLTWQLLFPLRHFLYPSNVNWTYEGHQYSWHMKLLSKRTTAEFQVYHPASQTTQVIDPEIFLTSWQARKMASRPDLILQFSHFLVQEAELRGYRDIEVRAFIRQSLNGRDPQLLIDPSVNLAAERRTLAHKPWVMPLTEMTVMEPEPPATDGAGLPVEIEVDEAEPGEI